VKGLRARGGITVTLEWSQGRLLKAVLLSERDQTVRVFHGGVTTDVILTRGMAHVIRG
jgi:hypothetical protein